MSAVEAALSPMEITFSGTLEPRLQRCRCNNLSASDGSEAGIECSRCQAEIQWPPLRHRQRQRRITLCARESAGIDLPVRFSMLRSASLWRAMKSSLQEGFSASTGWLLSCVAGDTICLSSRWPILRVFIAQPTFRFYLSRQRCKHVGTPWSLQAHGALLFLESTIIGQRLFRFGFGQTTLLLTEPLRR